MRPVRRWYVASVAVFEVLSGAFTFWSAPVRSHSVAVDIALLSALAIGGEMLSILLPRSASGSMTGVPYFALAMIVSGWESVLAVGVVKSAAELWARREPI